MLRPMRKCKVCSVPLTEQNTNRSYGLLCRVCRTAKTNAARAALTPEHRAHLVAISRSWYRANKDYGKSQARGWVEENKDHRRNYACAYQTANKAALVDYQRAYRLKNKVSLAAYKKLRYDADPAANMARSLAWQRANPERKRAISENRRVQKKATGRVSAAEWLAILESFGGACGFCLRTNQPIEMDHVQALSRGGRHRADNVIPLCRSCNATKREWGVLSLLAPAFRLDDASAPPPLLV